MESGILGRKIGMTQLITDGGEVIPVTAIEAGPCKIVQIKNIEKDGYNAIQLGFDEKRINLSNKPEKGHFNKAQAPVTKALREFRVNAIDGFELGQTVTLDMFAEGDYIDVTGRSKGKGMTGVMKRWGFRGGRASHGAEKVHRKPGSIGCSATPSRVRKGKKMAGRTGAEKVTVQNLRVAQVQSARNILLVRGAVPGANQSLIYIRKAVKKGNN